MRVDVLGIGFDPVTMDEALKRAVSLIGDGRPHYIVTPNPEIVYICQTDEEAHSAVRDADLVLPDGIGIVRAARKLGRPLKEKVGGMDFATALVPKLAQMGKKLFLLGAKPGVAEKAAEKLREANAGLQICGVADGYFTDDDPVLKKICDGRADVVFVCLGAPKQEKWMAKNIGSVGNALMIGLGGSLDGWAGNVKRAPRFIINLGFEWLYRLLQQPSRIGRMSSIPKFLRAVNKQLRKERDILSK